MNTFKSHAVSFLQTFIAAFLSTLGTMIIAIPVDKLASAETWTTSFIAGLVVGAVRVAVKVAWPKAIELVKAIYQKSFPAA